MSDHDPAEVRRVLRENGRDVPAVGKLSAANIALYEDILSASGDYPAGVTAADFDGEPGELEETLPGEEEILELGGRLPPRSEAAGEAAGSEEPLRDEQVPKDARPSAKARAWSLWNRGAASAQRARPARSRRSRRRPDWVPTAPMIERVWSELAWGAAKIPPLQRVFAAQAPMAGIVLQDAARDTVADWWLLQRLARGEDRIEAVNAMVGPPLWTSMIVRFGSFETTPLMEGGRPVMQDGVPVLVPVLLEDGTPAWHDQTKVMIGGLRFSLMSWLRISQRHAAEIIDRAEELDELGAQADELVKWILSVPQGRQSHQDVTREAREHTAAFLRAGHDQARDEEAGDVDDEQAAAQAPPAPAAPGHPASVAAGLGWPPAAAPDARTLGFVPPDPRIASQVVPRAPMPQA